MSVPEKRKMLLQISWAIIAVKSEGLYPPGSQMLPFLLFGLNAALPE